MKILFINISDIKGGAAKSMWRIGEELSKTHEVKFIVRDKFSNDKKVIGIKGNRWINRLFNLFGLQYKFLPSSWKIVRIAKRFNPDIISLNQIEGGYFQTRDLIKLTKIAPVVWTMHDLWAFMGNSHRELSQGESERSVYPQIGLPLGEWLLKQKKKIYDKCGLKIISPSQYLFNKKLKSICDKPGYIIPHGIDLDKFSPKKVKRILFVAEKTSKGLLKPILEKLDFILREKIILTIVGHGEIKNKYKNIIIENKGYVTDEDELISYYREADLFIYPTKADIFGLVVLESIACGTPAIAYNVGGVGEVLGEGGFLVRLNAHADFAFKIFTVLNNDKLRKLLSEKAREQASKFDIKEIAKQYENCFMSVRI
jgi:glycosyltransferase involved in cell wall biosynthesis